MEPWDGSTRPSYVSTRPRLAWTPHEKAAAQHLVDVHDHLRAEFEQIRSLVEQVATGELDAAAARSLVNVMTMRQNRCTLGAYCASYCRVLTTHHAIEDASMFPRLRAQESELEPVIDRLEAEHHVIAEALDGVDAALVAVVSGPDRLGGLRAAVDRLDEILASHLRWEERVLREPLARYGFM